jgi:hypothetical protein
VKSIFDGTWECRRLSLADKKQASAVRVHPRLRRWFVVGMEGKMFGPARGHFLFVGINRVGLAEYTVMAVQGPGVLDNPQDFLSHHAHALVAENIRTKALARKAAEKFAKRWMRTPDLDECGCTEIGS